MIVIDRFEGNLAVCENRENGQIFNIEKAKLPQNAREGDVLKQTGNQYIIDYEAKKEIENRINDKLNNLFED